MKILVNGEEMDVTDDLLMIGLLHQLDLQGKRLAVEINTELVPRSTFADHRINPGDKVEIVRAIGGG